MQTKALEDCRKKENWSLLARDHGASTYKAIYPPCVNAKYWSDADPKRMWNGSYPALYLSNSHPLSVNLVPGQILTNLSDNFSNEHAEQVCQISNGLLMAVMALNRVTQTSFLFTVFFLGRFRKVGSKRKGRFRRVFSKRNGRFWQANTERYNEENRSWTIPSP